MRDKIKMNGMLYKNCQREFTYGAKIVMRGMKVLDTIITPKEKQKIKTKT